MIHTREELDKAIDQWGYDRGIASNGTPLAQAIKTLEETTELLDAINTNDRKAIRDAIGDIYVTLRMVCATSSLDLDGCISEAYNDIKDRRGYLREDGTFIKECKQSILGFGKYE